MENGCSGNKIKCILGGAVDWNLRTFHGPAYTTQRGSTYNAYLIIDEEITLVDTVYGPFADDLIANISEIIDPGKLTTSSSIT